MKSPESSIILVYPYPRRKTENISQPYRLGNIEISISEKKIRNIENKKETVKFRDKIYEVLVFLAHNLENGKSKVSRASVYDFLYNNLDPDKYPEEAVIDNLIDGVRKLLVEMESNISIKGDYTKNLLIIIN